MRPATRFRMFSIALTAWMGLASPAYPQEPASRPARSPILVTFDLHMDPMGGAGDDARGWAMYDLWSEGATWLLGVTEPRGARLSFSTVGQFAEYCLADPDGAFPMIERLHESGGSIGTHSHDFVRLGEFAWSPLGANPTAEEIERLWADDVGMVDELVRQALHVADPQVRGINNLRGTHQPSDAADRYALCEEYGFELSQSGPTEDFAGLFQHYMYHPFRSSTDNELAEDRSGPVIMTHAGPVLGSLGVHKGIQQDMTLPKMQARFLAEALNWIYETRTGQPDRVWCYGWGSHGSDVSVSGDSRALVEPWLDWLEAHFIGRRIAGSVIARYSSYHEEGRKYRTWEAANPDLSGRGYPSREREWSLYPWLAPVAAHLWDASYVSALRDDAAVQVHRLQASESLNGPYAIVVAFPCAGGRVAVDLSAVDGSPWVRINPSSGAQTVWPATSVPVPPMGAILIPSASCPSLDEQKARIEAAYPVELRD